MIFWDDAEFFRTWGNVIKSKLDALTENSTEDMEVHKDEDDEISYCIKPENLEDYLGEETTEDSEVAHTEDSEVTNTVDSEVTNTEDSKVTNTEDSEVTNTVLINFKINEKASKVQDPQKLTVNYPTILKPRKVKSKEVDNKHTTRNVDHVKSKVFCDICDKMIVLKKGSKIIRHKFLDHDITNCDKCGRGFDDVTKFISHINKLCPRLPKVKLKCEFCGRELVNKEVLLNHIKTKHTPKEPCELCNKMVVNLSEHKEKEHNSDNLKQCHMCEYTSYDQANLNWHLKIQHKEFVLVPCPNCGKQIRDVYLRAHIRNAQCDLPEEERVKQRFKCDQCEKTFKKSIGLRTHIKAIHNNEKGFKCEHCEYRSYTKANVYMHSKRVHEKRELYVQCQYCDKKVINIEFHVKTFHKNCEK